MDAAEALKALRAGRRKVRLPSVVVAWDGVLPPLAILQRPRVHVELQLESGEIVPLSGGSIPHGHHRLVVETPRRRDTCALISAPTEAWRRAGSHRSWGLGAHLPALRSSRSRSMGDLRDFGTLCRWVGSNGGDLVMVLPLLATFNRTSPEPSPYSPVSRLFWSELILDLGDGNLPTDPPDTLDVTRADAEIRAALADAPRPDVSQLHEELARYAKFRGAQARLGRNWRDWPAEAREGTLSPDHVDPEEERFHLVAQTRLGRQLRELRRGLDADGMRMGLDLAVGVHPDGYDPWSRQSLFADGMSVGAPPDQGFPSGQDWGFSPILPDASRREGHQYLAASIATQMAFAGVLRVDHIMAWTRLYWIPEGFDLHEGTYVSYPADELFAVLTLESHRSHCEVVGENLGVVPPEVDEALTRHRIWGMYVAQFAAMGKEEIKPPTSVDMALIGTHDTPTLAGWLSGADIDERVQYGLLEKDEKVVRRVRQLRWRAAHRLADVLGCPVDKPDVLLAALLEWLGRSDSPLVVPWIEDLWLEERGVNLPGTRSSERPNWQRPMARLLDEILTDPQISDLVGSLNDLRAASPDHR